MSLPNWITVGRILLVPVFLFLGYRSSDAAHIGALVVFGAASASDSLDGYLARRWRTVSRVGKFLDPLADKILVGAALVVLVDTREFPLWAALVIALREVVIQVLRIRIVRRGGDLPASESAKVKTVLQIVMVGWWLLPYDEVGPVHWAITIATVAVTVYSGVEYFVNARRMRTGTAT